MNIEREDTMNAVTAASDLLVITVRSDADPCAFARFTWSDDMGDCDMLAGGLTEGQIDAILAVKGHEGAAVDGFTVTVT